jgi:hypothetical protein
MRAATVRVEMLPSARRRVEGALEIGIDFENGEIMSLFRVDTMEL